MMPINSDLSANSSGPAVAVRASSPRYLEPADMSDVLNEQLSYLLDHAGHHAAGCADCARYAEVVRLLMRPFE